MSRSYKKTPYCGDRKGKDKKKIANHRIRRILKQDPDLNLHHSAYKRHYCQYDICDYYWITSWDRYWANCLQTYIKMSKIFPLKYSTPPDKKEEYRNWLKWYRNK